MIGIYYELGRPDLIDRILELGHALAIAGHVKSELRRREVREGVERAMCQGKIAAFEASTAAEMEGLKEDFPTLGPGESDTLLLYGRVSPQVRSYCILDDRRARSAAGSMGIPFTGLLGQPALLWEKRIVGGSEAGEIAKGLRRAGFWMPANFAL